VRTHIYAYIYHIYIYIYIYRFIYIGLLYCFTHLVGYQVTEPEEGLQRGGERERRREEEDERGRPNYWYKSTTKPQISSGTTKPGGQDALSSLKTSN
jgi:hypothetical protein